MNMLGALARSVRPLVERHPPLAMAWRHYRDLRRLDRAPVDTPFGFKFVGHPAMEQGRFEPDEVKLVQRLLADADVFINVGANIGLYCCFALQMGRQVVAFEPVPGNLQYLYRNVGANGWAERIEVHPVALGEQRGLVDIYGGGTAASLVEGWAGLPSAYRQTVPLTTLDAAVGARFAEQRCLILVDVEGAELGMLRGAKALLHRERKPVWMIEINIDEHQPEGIALNPNLCATFDLFEQAGYRAWSIGASLEALPYERIRRIAQSGRNSLATHNFLFTDPGLAGLPA